MTAARYGLYSHSGKRPQTETPGSITLLSRLGPEVENERQRIRQQFEADAGSSSTLRALCELADRNLQRVFSELVRVHNGEAQGLSLLALGGYGRRLLFPYSDLDILFLFGNKKAEAEFRPLIGEFSRVLWDLGFRISSAGRTIDDLMVWIFSFDRQKKHKIR